MTQLETSTSSTQAVVTDVQQAELPLDTEPDQPKLDEEILNLLGETPSKDKKYGPDIRDELAVRWEHIATTGLSKDSKKELLEKHQIPKNCVKIDAPKLNPEIKAALSEMLIKKDKALENKQIQVAASISCISEALTRLFSLEQKDQAVIKLLIEAGRLMCDSQYNESMTRRNFICSTIKKDIKDQLFNTDIDGFLFGEKLADTLKAAKAITKSGAEIKIPPAKKFIPAQKPKQAQNLNQKPPLPAARQAGAARRFEPTTSTSRPRQQQQSRPPPRSYRHPGPRR